MKSENEVLHSLRICAGASGDCRRCAYSFGNSCRMSEMMKDAVELIEKYRKRVNEFIKKEQEYGKEIND